MTESSWVDNIKRAVMRRIAGSLRSLSTLKVNNITVNGRLLAHTMRALPDLAHVEAANVITENAMYEDFCLGLLDDPEVAMANLVPGGLGGQDVGILGRAKRSSAAGSSSGATDAADGAEVYHHGPPPRCVPNLVTLRLDPRCPISERIVDVLRAGVFPALCHLSIVNAPAEKAGTIAQACPTLVELRLSGKYST